MKEQLHQQQLRHQQQQQQKTLDEAELFQRERPAGQSTIMDDDDDDDDKGTMLFLTPKLDSNLPNKLIVLVKIFFGTELTIDNFVLTLFQPQ